MVSVGEIDVELIGHNGNLSSSVTVLTNQAVVFNGAPGQSTAAIDIELTLTGQHMRANTGSVGRMTTVSVHKLKDSLSVVLASVEAGESVEVTRYGKPIAIITGVAHSGRPTNVDPGSVRCDDYRFTADEFDEMLDGPVFPQ